MTYKNAVITLENFLASESYTGGFNIDQLLGFIVSALSCSDSFVIEDAEELVFAGCDDEINELPEDDNLVRAWVVVIDGLSEQLALDTFDLKKYYPLTSDVKAPTKALSDWCDGYLHGFLLTEEVWLDDFDALSGDPDFLESQDIIDDCDATLNLIATFAKWQDALNECESKQKLEESLLGIYQAINDGVGIRHQLALMLEEEKLEYADYDDEELSDAEEAEFLAQVETFYRDTPKIGRNDLCFCGSGKKYKKCCLN